LDAADLAGIRVVEMINDSTAVALNYAMLRQFTDTTQHHVFYDMGAGGTVASLIAFKNIKNEKKKRYGLM
jgi:hypoxia up-regulated 1